MKRIFAFLVIALLVLLMGCQARLEQLRPPLVHDGEVYAYMEPFPRGAGRLEFSLGAVYAIAGNGVLIPIGLRMPRFTQGLDSRQRLAAWGVLPPGPYSGLAFKVKHASLNLAEGGEASLLVPKKPFIVAFPFNVPVKGATVISMRLSYADAVKGVTFSPEFDLRIPVKPVDALLGYAVNYGSNDITIFDKAAMEATGAIPTGAGPVCMVVDRNLERGYVSLSREDAIQVIDLVTGEIIGLIRLNPGDSPHGLALTPDGKTLFAANSGSNTVSVIDPVSYMERSRIQVGTQPEFITLDRPAERAWVFNYFSNSISVIDISSNAVIATINTDLAPLMGVFNRTGNRLYILNGGSAYLTAIDPATFATVQKQYAGPGMRAIKVDTNTDLIYVGKEGDPYIEIYNPFTMMPMDYIKAGNEPGYITIDGDENNLCVADSGENALFFINLASRKIDSRIDVGKDPVWVALVGER